MSRRRKHRLKLRSLYVWHRYVGLAAALFALILAVTGIALNHTERLGLDSRYVQNDSILDWYGIETPDTIRSFAIGDQRVTQFGHHLYFGIRELPGEHRHLTGALANGGKIVIGVDSSIILLTPAGELIERLEGKDGVPAGMRALGTDAAGSIVVDGFQALYQPDRDFLEWKRWDGDTNRIQWVQPEPLPPDLETKLIEHYRGEILPWERVLLDLHSGRIISGRGVWLMDAAAAFLILLAFTGAWMWLKRRR